MSLHDTDKASNQRSNPSLNAQDGLAAEHLKAHATEGIAYRTEDTTQTPRAITKDDQILVYDEANLRIILGRLPDGTYGMVVSKEGVDVDDLFS